MAWRTEWKATDATSVAFLSVAVPSPLLSSAALGAAAVCVASAAAAPAAAAARPVPLPHPCPAGSVHGEQAPRLRAEPPTRVASSVLSLQRAQQGTQLGGAQSAPAPVRIADALIGRRLVQGID